VSGALQVKAGELATAEGLSYLEAKHLLLLSYCTHIVFYVLLKAEGAPVRDHPVIGRLLQLRTYLVRLLLGIASCCMATSHTLLDR
jgi:U3 small nucleolar RNA-associated protein 3